MKNVTIKTNQRGITLVALTVTALVLVILAGITFSTLLGENGLVNVAQSESEETQKKLIMEKLKLEVAESKRNRGEYVAENIVNNISGEILRRDFPIVVKIGDYKYAIDNKGRVLEANFYYLVEFDGNGVAGEMNAQKFKLDEEKKLEPNKYSHEGYTFVGWNTDPNGNGQSYENEQVVSNLKAIEYDVLVLYAQWIQGVAQANGVNYNSLQDAIDSVTENNIETTVKLCTNTTENISIKARQNILLDLQNHTINIKEYGNNAVVENSGTVKIKNGIIKSDSVKTATVNNRSGGKLTLDNVKVLMESMSGKQALYNEKGTVEITGTSYLSSVSSPNYARDNVRATVQNLANSTLIITGGNIISENFNGIENSGTMTIGKKDGIVNPNTPVICGENYGINLKNSAKFKLYDGIIKGKTGVLAVGDSNVGNNIEPHVVDQELDYIITKSTESTYKIAYLTSESTNATVTFALTGGNIAGDTTDITMNIEKGNTIGTIMGNVQEPTKANYGFGGWFTATDGGGERLNNSTVINNDVIYYAYWLPIYTVTFNVNANNGNPSVGEASRSVIKGHAIGELPVPTRNKYDFVGWFTADNGGTQINADQVINDNITYFAHWNKILYAQVNGQNYETVKAALATVPSNASEPTTITLNRDTVEGIDIASGKNVVLELANHSLSVETNRAVIENKGNLTVKGGTVTSTQATGTINNNNGGTLIIDGARIDGTQRSAIYNNDGGRVEIKGNSYIQTSATGKVSNEYRGAIHNISGGTVTITGGTVVGLEQQAVTNLGTMIVGTLGNLDTTTPVFISKTYGIYTSGTLKFYDGIAKGLDVGISGTITEREPNTQLASGTEVIDDKTYKINYLQAQ